MRGKQEQANDIATAMGITPACAGKTLLNIVNNFSEKDHPRVCGENNLLRLKYTWLTGSPPRVRGKTHS